MSFGQKKLNYWLIFICLKNNILWIVHQVHFWKCVLYGIYMTYLYSFSNLSVLCSKTALLEGLEVDQYMLGILIYIQK